MAEAAITKAEPEQPREGVRTLSAVLPVVEVTLLEDRAMVTRRAKLELPAGRSRLLIEGVAPVLVDKTLSAALRAVEGELGEGVRVRDARIVRRWVTDEAQLPSNLADLAERERELVRGREAKAKQIELLDAELAGVQQVASLLIAELSEDVGWGRAQVEAWRSSLDELDQRQLKLGQQRCELTRELERIERDIQDVHALKLASQTPQTRSLATLEIELMNSGDSVANSIGRLVELSVDYLIPGALWRPWHTARLIEGEPDTPSKLVFRSEACVWQASGEDWKDVELRFSTERPSLGVAPPLLSTDTLRARKKGSTVEVQTREQKIHTAGLGADQQGQAAVEEDELPGIDDGGEALLLRGLSKTSIPSDGRPYRVPLFEFETPAETALICTPELVPAVLLRSRQTNVADKPLLAGPVDLIRRSGHVGRTSILFIAPGERFDLGWGPDSSLRVHREVELLDVERKTLSSWTRKPRRVRVKLSNLGPDARRIEVDERVAVSEIEKVEVELVEASKKVRPDRDGFLKWEVDLRGFGHEELQVEWVLVVHDDVVGL